MSANPPLPPVEMVPCVEDCDEGRVSCPDCNGAKEVGIRCRPDRYHSMDPSEAYDYWTCERCDAEGSIECETCCGQGEYPYEEWMGVRHSLPGVV